MELVTPKAILFDWDNTLVDTWPVIHEALTYCLTEMGKEPWTLEEVKTNVQQSMRDAFPKIFGDDWHKAADYYQEGYLRVHCDKLFAYEGAKETLDFIKSKGIYNAVVSNKKGPTLRIEAEYLGWTHYFSELVGATDAANDKPHIDHCVMALPKENVLDPSCVWFVGDSEIDMHAAANCGFLPIFYGSKDKAETINYPISAIVSNQSELQELLKLYT